MNVTCANAHTYSLLQTNTGDLSIPSWINIEFFEIFRTNCFDWIATPKLKRWKREIIFPWLTLPCYTFWFLLRHKVCAVFVLVSCQLDKRRDDHLQCYDCMLHKIAHANGTECHFVLIIGLFFFSLSFACFSCRLFLFGRLSIDIERTFICNRLRTQIFWFTIRKVENNNNHHHHEAKTLLRWTIILSISLMMLHYYSQYICSFFFHY